MATKLKTSRMENGELVPADKVEREVDGLIVTLTAEGLMIREKGRQLRVGPFDYRALYLQGVKGQVAKDLEARQRPKRSRVSRGLLGMSR